MPVNVFLRFNISFYSYTNRLNTLSVGIKLLEYRGLESDIILMFEICHNLSDLHSCILMIILNSVVKSIYDTAFVLITL